MLIIGCCIELHSGGNMAQVLLYEGIVGMEEFVNTFTLFGLIGLSF